MSKTLIITGKYLAATEPKTLSNGKDARSFYVDMSDNPDYPNSPEFGLYGDKCSIVDNLTKGEEIEVFFNIKGIKYTNKEGKESVYTKLEAWKIQTANAPNSEPLEADKEESDDLPF